MIFPSVGLTLPLAGGRKAVFHHVFTFVFLLLLLAAAGAGMLVFVRKRRRGPAQSYAPLEVNYE